MLAVTKYPPEYVDTCRAAMAAQIKAYKRLAKAAGDGAPRTAFEPLFFNNLVLVLNAYFVHRTRALEGKDGNPMNEVRMLGNSILDNDAVLTAEKAIKFKPETSVLGLAIGDRIALDEKAFSRLADAFFTAIEGTFT
jgi:hypothetical protein